MLAEEALEGYAVAETDLVLTTGKLEALAQRGVLRICKGDGLSEFSDDSLVTRKMYEHIETGARVVFHHDVRLSMQDGYSNTSIAVGENEQDRDGVVRKCVSDLSSR